MEFASQICTTREQSERLLSLGLKKETADMTWKYSHTIKGFRQYECVAESSWDEDTIQSYTDHCNKMGLFDHWKHSDGSQMSNVEIYNELTAKDIPAWSFSRLLEIYLTSGEYRNILFVNKEDSFEYLVRHVEVYIKAGYIDENYLTEDYGTRKLRD